MRLWHLLVVLIVMGLLFAGAVLGASMPTAQSKRCGAAFAWSRVAADSAWVVMLHPECGVGIPAPTVKP